MPTFTQRLVRRKYVQFEHSELQRILGIVDLTALGIGSTIGVGIYVLAGQVSREIAGPAVTLCFLIAAVASLFAGVCYAEFGARVPKAGSAYIYTYVCVGEFVAFIIGWNLILEYVIGTASVASGFSVYVNSLLNNSMSAALTDAMPIDVDFLAPYPDFLAFGLSLFIAVLLGIGVKESTRMNSIFTLINIIIILFVIISGSTQANIENWKIPQSKLNTTCPIEPPEDHDSWGTGGFNPYGFSGIMQGAATCFFGFVGFDVIATTGEEAINPSRTIPIAIGLSLICIFISYFGMSAVITLVLPYCQQDAEASLVYMYEYLGWDVAKWFVSIGALFGFSASLLGALFPLPRVIYAMASDGLVFRFLARVSKRFKTPTLATLLSGLFAGGMALAFDLKSLVDMMSIGTLMAYTIVAICVMLLRFANDAEEEFKQTGKTAKSVDFSQHSFYDYISQLLNIRGLKDPTDLTASLVSYATMLFCVLVTIVAMLLVLLGQDLADGDGDAIAAVAVTGVLTICNVVVIALQPQSKRKLSFKVPFVPWIPALSSLINMYLMCNLSKETWIRFGVWMSLGLLVYFCYGIWNSTGDQPPSELEGFDNHGFSGKNALVIPTIEIQPATPAPSEPNTPTVNPKTKKVIPTSPLVKVEAAQMAGSEGKEAMGSENIALVAIDQVNIEDETRPEGAAGSSTDTNMGKGKGGPFKSTGDIGNLAALILAGTAADKVRDSEEKYNDIDIKPEDTVVEVTRRDEELKSHPPEPDYASIEDITGNLEQDKILEDGDSRKNVERAVGIKENLSSATSAKDNEPIYATVDKSKKTPRPMNLKLDETDGNKETSESEGVHVLRHSQSVPATMSHLQKFDNTSDDTKYGSVPSTPVTQRHPRKVLRRMSSFDEIPPSSPDSPFARHIKGFTIIPVQEAKNAINGGNDNNLDSDLDSSLPLTPHSGIIPLANSDNPRQLMNELYSKLSEDAISQAQNDKSASSDGEFIIFGSDQLGSKKGSRESKLDVLDTIRERGESKIIHNDEEHLSSLSSSVLLNNAPSKVITEENSNDNKEATTIENKATVTPEQNKQETGIPKDSNAQSDSTPDDVKRGSTDNGQLSNTANLVTQDSDNSNANVDKLKALFAN